MRYCKEPENVHRLEVKPHKQKKKKKSKKKRKSLSDKYIHNYTEITIVEDYYSSALLSSCIFKTNRCNTSRTISTLFIYMELLR